MKSLPLLLPIRNCRLARLFAPVGWSLLLGLSSAAGFEELGRWPAAPWREPSKLHLQGDLAYLGTSQGLMILDISNPARPQYVSHLDCVAGGTTDVYAAGDYVYLAAGTHAMRVVNEPALKGSVDLGARAEGVAVPATGMPIDFRVDSAGGSAYPWAHDRSRSPQHQTCLGSLGDPDRLYAPVQ